MSARFVFLLIVRDVELFTDCVKSVNVSPSYNTINNIILNMFISIKKANPEANRCVLEDKNLSIIGIDCDLKVTI